MKILLATEKPFAQPAVDGIRQVAADAGYELEIIEKYERAALLNAVATADALIVRSDKVDAEVLDAARQLKIVVRAGAGYDNVDLAAATAHGVVVMNTPGQNSNAVAELVFAMLLFLARQRFNGKAGTELMGKTIGLYSYGHVADCVARIAQGFGMRVVTYTRRPDRPLRAGVERLASPADVFAESDIVSLHIPLTDETRGVVNRELLGCMKPKAVLVNTARKEVVDEAALLDMMAQRPGLSYATDVKPDADADFVAGFADRYFATPKKMGAQTAEANINAGIAAARQIVAFLRDGDETFRVNK